MSEIEELRERVRILEEALKRAVTWTEALERNPAWLDKARRALSTERMPSDGTP